MSECPLREESVNGRSQLPGIICSVSTFVLIMSTVLVLNLSQE